MFFLPIRGVPQNETADHRVAMTGRGIERARFERRRRAKMGSLTIT